jgi:hypothetical protein
MPGDAFTAWVGQCLAPTLAPGDIVIADNLSSHKGQLVRQLIRNAGAHLLFLPPCSPDLNPIEMVFAKLRPCSAKPMSAPSTLHGAGSEPCLIPSHHTSARNTSSTQDILQSKSHTP